MMKNIQFIYFLVFFISYVPNFTISIIDRGFVFEIMNWSTYETQDTKTCLEIIGTGAETIEFGLFVSDQSGASDMNYSPPIYLAKEYLSDSINKISIVSYNCAYGFDDTQNGNLQEIIELSARELTEFSCIDCISHYNSVRMTANIRIVLVIFTRRDRGITFQNTKLLFLQRKLENGACCKNSKIFSNRDECPSCFYNYLIKLDATKMDNDRIYNSEDNKQLVFQTVVRNGLFDFSYSDQTKVNITIQENKVNNIDEFSSLRDVKLYPYKRLYYYSITGDFKNVVITGSLMLTSEGYCGNRGAILCIFTDEKITFNEAGDRICSNSIYDNPPDCNNDISPCATHPCQNHGVCISIPENYECECKPGWTGINCETPVCNPDCGAGVCLPGNKCVPRNAKFQLNSQPNTTCNNYYKCRSGYCDIINGIRKCVCDETRYAGDFCEFSCSKSCKNGKCVILKDLPTCICGDALLGLRCGGLKLTDDQILEIRNFNLAIYISGVIIFLIITICAIFYCYYVSKNNKYLNLMKFTKFSDTSFDLIPRPGIAYYYNTQNLNNNQRQYLTSSNSRNQYKIPAQNIIVSTERATETNNTRILSEYLNKDINEQNNNNNINQNKKQNYQSAFKPDVNNQFIFPDDNRENPYQ